MPQNKLVLTWSCRFMCHSSGTEMFQANNEESKILYPVPAVTSRRIHSTVIQSAQTRLLFPPVCVDFQWWCFWISKYTFDTLYLLFPPYETCNLSLALMSTRCSILATSSCCCLDVQYKVYWWSVQGTRILLRPEVAGTLSLFYPGIISVTLEELFLTYFLTCRMRWGSQGEFLAFLCRWVFVACGFCTRCHPSNSKLLSLGNCRGC